jgi:subtilisin family serine protease
VSRTLTGGRRRTWRATTLAIGAAVATTVSLTAPATAAQDPADGLTVVGGSSALSTDPADYTAGTYIVQLAGDPAASYEGDVAGFAATKPAKGAKIDADSAAVQRYRDRLVKQQKAVLASVGAKAVDNHSLVLNGVTTRLSAQQAAKLAGAKGVVSVNRTQLLKPQTEQSPQFLKMPQLWKDAGGRAGAGTGVVVGVIDSGIWYENKSFKGTGAKAPRGWAGECELGADGSGEPCNGKIIGARYYVDGFGADNIADEEFLSPRDGDGHGSHTASTAAGNIVRKVNVDGTDFGTISGMAPGAQIAAYKVCWTGNVPDTTDDDGCSNADSVSAIEDAVADGVDVINFSIGGSSESPVVDEVEIAFLNAAAAGVFVATSAGNNGPGESTLDHPSPWLTTTAASTHKINEKKLVLGDGSEHIGASATNELPEQTPMVLASASGTAGAAVPDAAKCFAGTLDPAKVSGKLVVCERGVNDRVAKSLEVRDAGGAGMVLVNPTANSLNADLHYVPSIHLDNDKYAALNAYAATEGATGAIVALEADDVSGTQVPVVADFSSRGPSTTTGGDILKPDIAAPGVDVLAAVAPGKHAGRDYDLISGTSMASPHIAGIAAVIKQIHKKWSPMEIKSAMMTTAGDTIGTTSPFDQGAGQVQPNRATAPGVVFDHDVEDWIGYLIDEGALDPAQFPGVDPVAGTDLNQASVANGSVAGTFTTTRTMTSTARNQSLRFAASVPGWRVTTDTPLVTFKKVGESKTVSLTFTKLTTTASGEWGTGNITWTGADRTKVRIPVALKATTIALSDADIDGTGKPSGSTTVSALPGFSGTLSTQVAGMAGTVPVTDGTLVPNASALNPTAPAEGPSVKKYTMTTNGTSAVRFSVDTESAGADYDLYLYIAGSYAGGPVAVSGTASGDEELTLTVGGGAATGLPLEIFVHHWGGAAGDSYTYRGYNVGTAPVGNLTVTPPTRQVTQGTPVDFTLGWNGLAAEQSYFGWVNFAAPNGEGELAFVEVR